jgi:hypothetical protein
MHYPVHSLLVVFHCQRSEIQDVLTAVHASSKRKRASSSSHQQEPTMPTQRRPQHKPRAASPEHSLMHSVHAISAAQAAADAQKHRPNSPLRLTAESDTSPTPPAVSQTQDTTLPDAPTPLLVGILARIGRLPKERQVGEDTE